MKATKEKKLVPELRFKKFRGEWLSTTLRKVSKNVSYGMNASATKFDGVNKYLRITDIDEDSREFIPNPLSSPEGDIDEKFVLKEGDIVFARTGASVGKSYLYNKKDGRLLYAGFLIKFSIVNANPYFIYQQSFRESYKKWVQIYSMRSGQPGLNAEEYKELEFNLPQLPEQQKIATFLSKVDEKITLLTKKKELLEEYKKGVTQKIFKQEIRFKILNETGELVEPPKWEKRKLEDYLSIPEKVSPAIIDVNKILTVKLNLNGVYLNQRTESLKIGATKYIKRKRGQFIYGKQNLFNGAFGIVPDEFDGFLSSGDVPSLNIDNSKMNPQFLIQFFGRKSFYNQLETIASGSGSKRIHESTLLSHKVIIPSMVEQTKIANFLSSVDKKIDIVNTQLNQAKTWKKGLLQKMFV